MKTIGVDIGGMSFKIGIVEEGKILYKYTYHITSGLNQEDTIKELGEKILQLMQNSEVDSKEIKGVGIGCPGTVSSKTGICNFSGNLKWNELNICKIIQETTGLPAKLSNDANVACLAEAKYGCGKEYKDVVMITLGTGIGGGIVINNELYEGNDGKGAEIGHQVIKVGGRKCGCGRKGCFEAYASATALLKDTKRAMLKDEDSMMWKYCNYSIDNVSGLTAFDCAKQGDQSAEKVIDNYIYYLSEGILNLCNIFRPECIVIGGGISNQKDYLVNKINTYLEANHYGIKGSPKVEIRIATLGNDAGIIGAASLF